MPLPVGVALGILLALAVVAVVLIVVKGVSHQSAYDCAMENADRAQAGEPLKDCN